MLYLREYGSHIYFSVCVNRDTACAHLQNSRNLYNQEMWNLNA
jgi:hypothetical protein